MLIKDKDVGKQFITNNLFSKNLISKNDRKLNRCLRFKYNCINGLRLTKFFKKKSWFDLLDNDWAKQTPEYKKKYINNQVALTTEDLKLESLVIYDLIPKEYISEYKKKYLIFRDFIVKPHIGKRQAREISSQFDKMQLARSVGGHYNVEFTPLKEGSILEKYFSYLHLEIIGISKSFFAIKYTLTIKPEVNKFLGLILESVVCKEANCVSNDKWWKKNSFAGLNCYDFGNDAKKQAISDYVLELKAIFFKEIKTNLISKFYNWELIPPSIEVYSSKTLLDNRENILDVLYPYGKVTNANKDNDLVFIPAQQARWAKKKENSSIIIASSKYFEQDERNFYKFEYVDEYICNDFADYFILDSLSNTITNKIYVSQQKIEKTICSKQKLKKFLSVKMNTDKELYFYKRLYKEFDFIDKEKLDYRFREYLKHFNDLKPSEKGFVSFDDFKHLNEILFWSIKDKNTLIDEMYKYFEENIKLIESKYNYAIVKWTLIVGGLTLISTIFLANNSELLNSVLEFFKRIFN